MENKKLALLLGLWLAITTAITAQDTSFKSLGAEIQAYPAGAIMGIRADISVSQNITLNGRIGYNLARRGDLGEHDDEKGGGLGFSVGGRYFFKQGYQGFFLGLRTDFWFLDIDWKDTASDPERIGSTDITVLQPLAEGGYAFIIADGPWVITPKISLGYEINIKSVGEDVGEGAISLIGVSITRRFSN